MRGLAGILIGTALTMLAADLIYAQGRGGQNWNTVSADAQRTGWLRTETRISAEALQASGAGGFQLLWKVKPENQPRQLNTLTQPLILGNLISHKGFKALAFFGGSGDVVYAYDYDLGKVYWSQKLSTGVASQPATPTCPGGLTSITRSTPLTQSAAPAGPGALGRGGPGAGAPPGPPAGRGPSPPIGVNPANLPITGAVWAISSGGMVHALNPHIGADLRTPVRIVPAGAKVIGSVLVNDVLFAATTDSCGGAANGVYALDVSKDGSATTMAKAWATGGATIAGSAGPTLGLNDTLYVATGAGGGRFANAVVAIDSKTLQPLDWFAGDVAFATSPVAFTDGGRDFVAAAARDGRLYVLDGRAPGGADHRTPLARSAAYSTGTDTGGAVTTWQERDGARWLLVASAGAVAADTKFGAANGAITNGFVAAFKFSGQDGSFKLEPAWTSRDMTSPAAPIVLNDVVFALSTGAFRGGDPQLASAQRLERSTPAVLYALDAKTGKELWSSGRSVTASVQNVGPSGQDGQVYVVAADGTLYAFGIPLEH